MRTFLVYLIAPLWAAHHSLVTALEISAARKLVTGRDLSEPEKAIVIDALQRVRVRRPGAYRRLVKALGAHQQKGLA